MVQADLNFTRAYTPPGSDAVALNFGLVSTAPVDPLALQALLNAQVPVMRLAAAYASNTSRPVAAAPELRWQRGAAKDVGLASDWLVAENFRAQGAAAWANGLAAQLSTNQLLGSLATKRDAISVPWVRAEALQVQPILSAFEEMLHLRRDDEAAWQQGAQVAISVMDDFVQLLPFKHHKILRWQDAELLGVLREQPFSVGRWFATHRGLPWQPGRKPPSGREVPVLPPEPPTYAPGYDLNFICKCLFPKAQAVMLNFGLSQCPEQLVGLLSILPARFYMTINTLTAELLPSLAPVPIYAGATISQDVGSYAWTLSATGPASLYGQLAGVPGTPKVLRVAVNGIAFVFQLDSPRRSQSFGKTEVQITGRSVTAALGTGFARETTRLSTAPFTAQQLAAEALGNTGVSLGWGIEDWLVPAGAWSHSGTPLSAVQAIAEAAGGYVQSHRTLAQLLVRHPYPLLPGGVPGGPWNWNGAFAADVVIAPDVIVSRSSEVRPAAAINAVYVSGANQGVLALVKREGTAGDALGSMAVDALITGDVVARQRGTAILGAGGDKLMHQLELPVLVGAGQPGVLSTDQLIQVQDSPPWRGRVRAVSVTHQRPQVRQTVLVEAA